VRDAGVGEQALHARLEDGGQAAEQDGDGGTDEEEVRDLAGDAGAIGEQSVDDASEDDEAGGLGTDGKEGGDGSGRALIHIRHPHVEGRGGDLEAECGEEEGDAEEKDALVDGGILGGGGDAIDRGAGRAIDPGRAIETSTPVASSTEMRYFTPASSESALFRV